MNSQNPLPPADPDALAQAQAFFAQQSTAPTGTAADEPPAIGTYAERVEEVARDFTHEPNLTAIDALVADARAKLGIGISDSTVEHPFVQVDAPEILNALSAERAALKRQAGMIDERVKQIDDIAKELLGDAHDLKAAGVTVVSYRPSTSRVINQAVIKQNFPDVPGNEEFWTDSERRTINWK